MNDRGRRADELVCLSLTYKTAPAELRGRFQIGLSRQRALLRELGSVADELAVLSTCGRFELYALQPADDLPQRCLAALGLDDVSPRSFDALTGDACARHLMRVAAGLESHVIGEPQILTQTRAAHGLGLEEQSIGPVLSALFRTAIHTGRRVRRDTDINPGRRSFAQLAVDHVERERGPLATLKIAVAGGGAMAREVATYLAARRAGSITIVNRSIERARDLAIEVRATAIGLDDLPIALAHADAAIVCTGADRFVLDGQSLRMRSAGDRLSIVDLSLPRNVDPNIAHVQVVTLVHFDELRGDGAGIAECVAQADRIIEDQLQRFLRWRRARTVAPMIRAMLRSVDSRNAEEARRRRHRLHRPIVRLVESCAA